MIKATSQDTHSRTISQLEEIGGRLERGEISPVAAEEEGNLVVANLQGELSAGIEEFNKRRDSARQLGRAFYLIAGLIALGIALTYRYLQSSAA